MQLEYKKMKRNKNIWINARNNKHRREEKRVYAFPSDLLLYIILNNYINSIIMAVCL
jgi:hypothetical protein